MSRKGQGISVNMVIIAAIALLVLIIAVMLVSKGGRNIDQNAGAQSCLAQGGACRQGMCEPENNEELVNPSDPQMSCNVGQVCCRYDFEG